MNPHRSPQRSSSHLSRFTFLLLHPSPTRCIASGVRGLGRAQARPSKSPTHSLIPALAAALLLFAASAGAAELRGNVVGVSDGDTITVLDQTRKPRKIRLVGIDAPEMRQPYGTRARQNLSALVFGKPVVVVWHKRRPVRTDRRARARRRLRRMRTSGLCAARRRPRADRVGAGLALQAVSGGTNAGRARPATRAPNRRRGRSAKDCGRTSSRSRRGNIAVSGRACGSG